MTQMACATDTITDMDTNAQIPTADGARWRATLARDRRHDGAFVFAVTSTRIYCRPSCPSRRPRVDRVRFYETVQQAAADGFRACKRCDPDRGARNTDAELVETAMRLLLGQDRFTLPTLAHTLGTSRTQLLRAFTRIVGCTPAAWQRGERATRLRASLVEGVGVSAASFDAGFPSLPAAYAAAASHLGMTPGLLKRGAPGVTVFYTIVPCVLGQMLMAMTTRGICRVVLDDSRDLLEALVRREFHAATLVHDDALLREVAAAGVARAAGVANGPDGGTDGGPANSAASTEGVPLDLTGTAFQQRVWRELQRIPRGETITYGEVAERIGSPGAVRAVGTACGANLVALLVPCHRVVRGDGGLGGYRWGVERKARLLAGEREGEGAHQHGR